MLFYAIYACQVFVQCLAFKEMNNILCELHVKTERRGPVVNTPATYLEGNRSGCRLPDWGFRCFPQPLHADTAIVPQNESTTASFQIFSDSLFTYH
jgi:hypothetical protein